MKYFVHKIAHLVSTLLLVSAVTFIVFQILPGDPVSAILGIDADKAQIENMQRNMGLGKPPIERYIAWLSGAIKGDFGFSYRYQKPVLDIVLPACAVTVSLAVFVLILTAVAGVMFGTIMALFDKSALSFLPAFFSQLGVSVPSFCVSLFFIIVFSVKLHLLPLMGYVSWQTSPLLCLRSLCLPAFSITFGTSAILARYVRSSLLSQLGLNYVRSSRGRGLGTFRVVFVHAMPNALIPVLTISGMIAAQTLGGSIIVENVFSLPGAGKLLANSIASRDYPIVQALVLYLSAMVVFCNFITDTLYSVVSPAVSNT